MTTPDSADAPLYPIASVDNALRLLLMFREHREIRLSDAAVSLGVARSTAHRLLAMLAYHGFVRRAEEARGYVAGTALYDIGLAVIRQLDVRTQVRPFLEEVAAATDETVHCGVLDGAAVRYIDAVESTQALRVAARTGRTLPAHCSSAGKALLALLSPDRVRERYLDEALSQTTGSSIRSRSQLEHVLEEIRGRGYAENREESEEGVVAVGVAIADELGGPSVGISCAAPKSRMNAARSRQIGALLSEMARRASDKLARPIPA